MKGLMIVLMLFAVPLFVGLLLKRENEGVLFTLTKGYIFTWAVFFIVCVPCIIWRKDVDYLLKIYIPLVCLMAVVGLFLELRRRHFHLFETKKPCISLSRNEVIYLGIIIGLWLFQMYKAIFYAFADGDDAYYVGMINGIATGNPMYVLNPYTGVKTDIIYRYALAPFPAWIASISCVTKIHPAVMAHVVISPALISITYVIYYKISTMLFDNDREKQYVFMILFSVFSIFSNVSQSMTETFRLTRSRQGKAALASIIIPMIFLLFLEISRRQIFKITIKDWCIFVVVFFAGALTSVFSNVLMCIAMGAFFCYSLYRKADLKSLLYEISSLWPCAFIVLLYLRLA